MKTESLVLCSYVLAALGAVATYIALPAGGKSRRAPAILIGLGAAIGLGVLTASRFGGDTAHNVVLALLTIISVGGAARVITHPRPVYSALYFVLVALASAALAVLCGAEFLGAALVIVYAGAILVTYVFVIMLAHQSAEGDPHPLAYDGDAREPALAVIVGFALSAAVAGQLISMDWSAIKPEQIAVPTGNTIGVGQELLTHYAIPVELAGVLLLVAMIGAIALSRKPVAVESRRLGEAEPAPGEIGRHVKPF